MTLSLVPPRLSFPSPYRHIFGGNFSSTNGVVPRYFRDSRYFPSSSPRSRCALVCRASSAEGEEKYLDDELLRRIIGSKDADQVLDLISEYRGGSVGVVETDTCFSIIEGALDRNNTDLALSVFSAMRSSSFLGIIFGPFAFYFARMMNYRHSSTDLSADVILLKVLFSRYCWILCFLFARLMNAGDSSNDFLKIIESRFLVSVIRSISSPGTVRFFASVCRLRFATDVFYRMGTDLNLVYWFSVIRSSSAPNMARFFASDL